VGVIGILWLNSPTSFQMILEASFSPPQVLNQLPVQNYCRTWILQRLCFEDLTPAVKCFKMDLLWQIFLVEVHVFFRWNCFFFFSFPTNYNVYGAKLWQLKQTNSS